jgi:hypothetical protein
MAQLIAEIVKNQNGQEDQAPKTPDLVATTTLLSKEIAKIAVQVARLWYVVLPGLYLLFLLFTKFVPLLPSLLSRNARRRISGTYTLCLLCCAGVGRSRRTTESALEHATRLSRENKIMIAPVVDLYLKAAFGEYFAREDLDAERPALDKFTSTFRKNVAWPLRILGVMNPLPGLHRRH